jgi:hypothetical protein
MLKKKSATGQLEAAIADSVKEIADHQVKSTQQHEELIGGVDDRLHEALEAFRMAADKQVEMLEDSADRH